MINQGPQVLGQKNARELTVHFDRLANIFRYRKFPCSVFHLFASICIVNFGTETICRYVNHPEAVADAIQKLWPIFKAIFDV